MPHYFFLLRAANRERRVESSQQQDDGPYEWRPSRARRSGVAAKILARMLFPPLGTRTAHVVLLWPIPVRDQAHQLAAQDQ
jgi:hypothetical protein